MDKEIKINKGTGRVEKSEKVIAMDDLTKAREFSPEELQGVVNLSLNQYLQDYVSLEIQHRVLGELKETLSMVDIKHRRVNRTVPGDKPGTTKVLVIDPVDEVGAKINEVIQRQENLAQQIKQHRQVREELGDGRFVV
jgi:hypothetical protein